MLQAAVGRRLEAVVDSRRGKYSRHRLFCPQDTDIALDATLRAAAARIAVNPGLRLQVQPQDLRRKIRRHRSPFIIVFVVDNSWSIHVERTLERTKGVVFSLLRDARRHRDRVALVTFRHGRRPEATVCLPPTNSYLQAVRRLARIPLSGSTPLPDALRKGYLLLRQEIFRYHNVVPVLVLVTDGLPTAPIRPGGDPYEEVRLICQRLRREAIPTVVVDTEPQGPEAGNSNCAEIAAASGGICLPLSSLGVETMELAVAAQLHDKPLAEKKC